MNKTKNNENERQDHFKQINTISKQHQQAALASPLCLLDLVPLPLLRGLAGLARVEAEAKRAAVGLLLEGLETPVRVLHLAGGLVKGPLLVAAAL